MFDERRMSQFAKGRPISVHLKTKPYNRNSPIVARSLTATQIRPGTQLYQDRNEKKAKLDQMRLKSFNESLTEKVKKRKEIQDKLYDKQEKYLQWRTQQLIGTIKPPRSEPDHKVLEKIRKNAEDGKMRLPALLPDDDGYVIREDPFLPNGKRKIIFNHDLPRETKAIHKQTERLFYWGA